MTIPREPDFYHPTTHAKQQRRNRGIDWYLVGETIKDGSIKPTHKDSTVLFIKEFENTTLPVGVVANTETGEVVTVEWRK